MTVRRIAATVVASLMLVVMCTGCVTQTRVNFDTDVEGATVYINGEKAGVTPFQVKMSNAIWNDPDIVIKKEGYKDLHTDVKKEVKAVNLVCGILLWTPSLLWCFGPQKNQNYMMIEENK